MSRTTPPAPVGAAGAGAPFTLGDFTTDRRLLILIAMALVVGTFSAVAAWLLVDLIALVTNVVWFGRFSVVALPMAAAARGPWMVLAPALGGLVIGLMARFGSEKIRGHRSEEHTSELQQLM